MSGSYQGTRRVRGVEVFGGLAGFLLVGKRVDLLDPTTAALGSRRGDQPRTSMYPTASPGPPISGSSRVFAGGGEKHPAITVEIERKKKKKKKS